MGSGHCLANTREMTGKPGDEAIWSDQTHQSLTYSKVDAIVEYEVTIGLDA